MTGRPFTGHEPRAEAREAQPEANGRTEWAAWMLGGDPEAVAALVAGLPVPRRRLAADTLQALGEPLDGPDVTLDEALALRLAVVLPAPPEGDAAGEQVSIVSLDEFADADEEGDEALLGEGDNALIPEGADVMFYGDGGAGKTTLAVDLACHLAAGDAWLGIPISRPARVLLIENEGPRPRFRLKLRRKRDAWPGSPLGDRIKVFERPWGGFSFDSERWRELLAARVRELGIDVIIVGPVTSAGMDAAGTLQEVRAFMALVGELRARSGRRLVVVLIHHENKGGQVSGAWEGAGDTLFHVQPQGHGRLRLYVQKARWASDYHATTLHLLWADGDGFEVEEKPELDDEALAHQIVAAIEANPGLSWGKVEEATPGVARKRRRSVRDGLLEAGRVVNVAKDDSGQLAAVNHCQEAKRTRLYLASDPTIRQLRPEPGAVGAQSAEPAPLWEARG